jgi:translation initiation factor IF-2
MAEYRLAKVASELNRSAQALADFLNGKGFDVAPKPTTKISEEMYDVLLQEFSKDKAAKDEAKLLKTQRDIRQGTAVPPTPATKPTTPKVEEKVTPVKSEPEVISAPVSATEESVIAETPEKTEVRKEELAGPKILGKIDLNPKKSTPKEVEKKVEPTKVEIATPIHEEPPAVEVPALKEVVTETAAVESPKNEPVIAKIDDSVEIETNDELSTDDEDVEKIETKFEKLSGPKVLGKINLPAAPSGVKALAGDAREDLREKRKRKRKQAGTEKVAVQEKIKQDEKQTFNTGPKKPEVKTEISQKDVQSKIKNTMGKIGNAGRNRGLKQKIKQQNKESRAQEMARNERLREQASKILKVTEFLTANELASMMNMAVTQVISSCFQLGMMVSINQRLDAETIQLVADNFGYEVEFVDAESTIEAMDNEVDREEDLKPRAPIVTVMGHVDHGKTSLLDNIRKSNVIAGEAGGITQHIGSYEVTMENGKKITFLDTPGHEAFTAMRARGAKVTDIAIIVIAADDAVMPQTREAIAHSQAAGVPMIFALNKVDKDGANSDRIREQLAAMNILVEDWGGKFQCQEISAKKGMNIDKLLEKVLLEAEMMELKANPNRNAKGTVIEATQEKGRGIVCNLLVQNGTLKVGDHIVAGPYYTKVRAMFNERGGKIDEAPPSAPVRILGFSEAPTAGDIFVVFEEESEAKQLANKRLQLIREQGIRTKRHITLDEIGRRLAIGNFKELKLIVKGDVDGSVEALSDSLLKLSTEEIAVNVIHSGVGQITESDVLLASASDAIIVGFQVRPSAKARQIAENEEIDIRTYSIIYQAIEEIKSAMEGMLSPEVVEKIIGNVEVRDVFKISKVGSVAGCYVTSGSIERKAKIRVIRDGVVIHSGELASLKRFKDDVKDVQKGYECGLQIERFNDIEVGDYLEVFKEEEVKRKL